MDLSVVTTLYRTAPYLEEFCARTLAVAQSLTDDFEIILVNDGSPDDSLEIALSLYRKDRRITIIDLSRNFGHHRAIMTGLAQARGMTLESLAQQTTANAKALFSRMQ